MRGKAVIKGVLAALAVFFACNMFQNNKAFMPKKEALSVSQIQGDWTCVKRDQYEVSEWAVDHPNDLSTFNLRIKGDSLWRFEYPYQYYGSCVLQKDSFLHCRIFETVELRNDTLIQFKKRTKQNGEVRYYVRDTFSDIIVEKLKKNHFNPEALSGTWYLPKMHHDPYSGEPPSKIDYPFALPWSVLLNKNFFTKNYFPPDTLLLPVNGKKRKFIIRRITWLEREISLDAGNWYKKGDFNFVYFPSKETMR